MYIVTRMRFRGNRQSIMNAELLRNSRIVLASMTMMLILAACSASVEQSSPSDQPRQTPTPTATAPPDVTATPAANTDPAEATPTPDPPEASETPAPAATESELEEQEFTVTGQPVSLEIERTGVDAYIEYVGLTDDGAMDVPQEWENVGWFEPGTLPGEVGNSVIAGHYDSPTGPAVFFELRELEPGDLITVITDEDEQLTFEVTKTEMVLADDAPLEEIFGSSEDRNLNLITCDGIWDQSANMYDHRLVVYTTLVTS